MLSHASDIQQTVEHIRTAQRDLKARQRKKPRCEVCGKRPAVSFSRFHDRVWLYTCYCTSDYEAYYIMLSDYCGSQASRATWDRHLEEKDGDAINIRGFYNCVARFLDAGGRMK